MSKIIIKETDDKKQFILENIRNLMNKELERRGLSEAKLMDLGLVGDFNDEIYLLTEIVYHENGNITLNKMFELVKLNINSFIHSYMGDYILATRLNNSLSSDMIYKIELS